MVSKSDCKLVPAGNSNKITKETQDIRKGFQFVGDHGPEEIADGEFATWTEEQVNDPSGPLYKWDKGTIKGFLRCMADKGSQANSIKDWPPHLGRPHALGHQESTIIWIGKSEVGKSPVSYTLFQAHVCILVAAGVSPGPGPLLSDLQSS